jgi:hypothetical protein
MFCDRCGTEVQAEQRFCGRCGKEFSGASAVGYPRRGRVSEHVRLLAIFWLALSALTLVGGAVLYVLANTLFLHLPSRAGGDVGTAWLHPFLTFIAVVVAMKAVAGFFVGWGLLQRDPWARVLALILGFLALFNVPFGTAVGIYTLWVLLPAESEAEYREQAESMQVA